MSFRYVWVFTGRSRTLSFFMAAHLPLIKVLKGFPAVVSYFHCYVIACFFNQLFVLYTNLFVVDSFYGWSMGASGASFFSFQ